MAPAKKAQSNASMGTALKDTLEFYKCMAYFIIYPGISAPYAYAKCPYFPEEKEAKIHCYALALSFYLWKRPHYRNGDFQEDLAKNLRNVAVPGTGIPLSLWCYFRPLYAFFVLIMVPLYTLIGALYAQRRFGTPWPEAYSAELLRPDTWFYFWRVNCALASYHSLETGCGGYRQEDKWTFLVEGEELGVPVSPVLSVPDLVIKDRNEEGGMGVFFYKNATCDGDWIIQERLHNSPFVANLLPNPAPLSTFRVITASRWWLLKEKGANPDVSCVTSLSCVFRAGRAGALTDHSSILFDVDTKTGKIKEGTTNAHWYMLGPDKVRTCPWVSTHDIREHPDNKKLLVGETVPDMEGILKMVNESHFKMCPDVPLVGWDVALTDKGMYLLEVNLSCNFFRGTFDKPSYVRYLDDYFLALEVQRQRSKKSN